MHPSLGAGGPSRLYSGQTPGFDPPDPDISAKEGDMGLRINDTIPNLTVTTDQGPVTLHDWIGDHWAILFSHPKDFTPVCTTEFGAVARLADEWAARGTKVMGISVDGVDEHVRWKADIAVAGGAAPTFPIVADRDLTLSKAFDMLPAEAYLPDAPTPNDTATVRVVFIIGPDKKLKLSMTYPMNVGRNFAEVLRALDALQTANGRGVATPANWNVGDDVIIPLAVSDEAATAKFGSFTRVLPYLRTTSLQG
jgi:thioredoxin-dependent peroxiredoxin